MRASPSASDELTVTVSVSPVRGVAWSIETESTTGAELTTRAPADVAGALEAEPSETVARTAIVSPLSPWPGCDRSSVAAVAPEMSTPPESHWRADVNVSPSASVAASVKVSVSFVLGAAWSIDNEPIVGAELRIVTSAEVVGADGSVPSEAVTRTEIASPLSPWPVCERSSVAAVAPAMSTPSRSHWYA